MRDTVIRRTAEKTRSGAGATAREGARKERPRTSSTCNRSHSRLDPSHRDIDSVLLKRKTGRRLSSFPVRRSGIRVDESFPSEELEREGPESPEKTPGALFYDKFHRAQGQSLRRPAYTALPPR